MSVEDDVKGKLEKIGEVSGNKGVGAVDHLQEDLPRVAPDKGQFDAILSSKTEQTNKIDVAKDTTTVNKTSPMDVASEATRSGQITDVRATAKDVSVKAKETITQIDGIKGKLSTPGLQLPESDQKVLQNKLVHVDENLRTAMSKAGLEYNPGPQPIAAAGGKLENPIERFLGFLTNSQSQLANLSTELDDVHFNKKDMSPASMLRVQIKMNGITQQVEFFSAALNKALESIKQVMSIQV